METPFLQIIIFLVISIVLIVLLTVKYKIHAFFALFAACIVMGAGVGLPAESMLNTMKQGFGHIMQSLGFIIVLGTVLGVILEHTGCTNAMAAFILKRTGEKRSALAMNITGFIVGLPIFCDSGYIVLSGLNNQLAERSKTAMPFMAGSLAVGLYAVHCLIPPHPGAAAAAGTLNVDFGKLILLGVIVAIPASAAGYLWSRYAAAAITAPVIQSSSSADEEGRTPSPLQAFLPVIIPILLIASAAFIAIEKNEGLFWKIVAVAGNPVVALCIGILLTIPLLYRLPGKKVSSLLQEGAEKAGGILVIIGAGGSFGAILAATHIGTHLGDRLPLAQLGILFPFLLTSLLKTAQGSSTVAIITAASIVQPLLPALGLDTEPGRLLAILSMGAGSMMISHANDAYFWVISKFSGVEMKTMLRVYSAATIWMGIIALLTVYLLSIIMY
ncbi:gluconate transporter [Terrimonas sp.]|uniref:GntP family permease n=1 Tax=Terrimonas sp. TaxID=1914338 RepID=UPI000D515BF3|nr:GntP family permease [Terrimonas sp.]PVD50967.1 gluconate transporter [Terrimonas sp.]